MFRVAWLQSALDELADLWTRATSAERQAVTAAVHVVEQRLRTDPAAEGESRPKGRRFTFVPPVAVTFRVNPDENTVTVIHVRLYRRKMPP
jgi:hypothetical protein